MRISRVLVLIAGLLLAASPGYALTLANVVDLLTAGSSGSVNEALFSQQVTQPTGTGIYDPFLRLQDSPMEEAFNTDYRDGGQAPLDAHADLHTHAVLMGSLEVINIGGVDYYGFTLDIDEPNGGGLELISLDELRFYVEDAPDLNELSDLTNLAWDMDAGINTTVYLDGSNLSSGNGADDMQLLVKKSYFDAIGAQDDQYLYLYSKFGGTAGYQANGTSSDGSYEEWSAMTKQSSLPPPQVPEPGTMVLLGSGLAGLAGWRARKRK